MYDLLKWKYALNVLGIWKQELWCLAGMLMRFALLSGAGIVDMFGKIKIYIKSCKSLYIALTYLSKMTNITFYIDDKLHYNFKNYCISKKVSMKFVLISAIERIIKKRKIKN